MDYFFADPQIPDGSTSFDTCARGMRRARTPMSKAAAQPTRSTSNVRAAACTARCTCTPSAAHSRGASAAPRWRIKDSSSRTS
eukprot:11363251-Alexandrium_andersonii.AAC.1